MKSIVCSYCGSHTHEREFCPKTWDGQGNLANRRCSYCGSRNHNLDRCSKTFNGQKNNMRIRGNFHDER